jgi:hypothetical protein
MSLNETARKTGTSRWPGMLLLALVLAAFCFALLIYQGAIISNQNQIKAESAVILKGSNESSIYRSGTLRLQEQLLHNQVQLAKASGAKDVSVGPPPPKVPLPLKFK